MERVVKRAAHDILRPTLFIERARRCSLVGEPEPAVCADMGLGDLVIQKDLCSASGWGCMIHLPIRCAGLVGRGNDDGNENFRSQWNADFAVGLRVRCSGRIDGPWRSYR